MSNEDQVNAEILLTELKKAYRRLPRHVQVRVACLLRECAPAEELEAELAS